MTYCAKCGTERSYMIAFADKINDLVCNDCLKYCTDCGEECLEYRHLKCYKCGNKICRYCVDEFDEKYNKCYYECENCQNDDDINDRIINDLNDKIKILEKRIKKLKVLLLSKKLDKHLVKKVYELLS